MTAPCPPSGDVTSAVITVSSGMDPNSTLSTHATEKVPTDEHPLCRMWRERLNEEVGRQQARAARRAEREAEHASWSAAWEEYKALGAIRVIPKPLPRWWNATGWLMWLLRLHAAGRPT